eukprot:scaffold84927_cov27-Phaeocystis_antarctica.AAC.1
MSHARAVVPVLLSPLGGHWAPLRPRRLSKLPLGEEERGVSRREKRAASPDPRKPSCAHKGPGSW